MLLVCRPVPIVRMLQAHSEVHLAVFDGLFEQKYSVRPSPVGGGGWRGPGHSGQREDPKNEPSVKGMRSVHVVTPDSVDSVGPARTLQRTRSEGLSWRVVSFVSLDSQQDRICDCRAVSFAARTPCEDGRRTDLMRVADAMVGFRERAAESTLQGKDRRGECPDCPIGAAARSKRRPWVE